LFGLRLVNEKSVPREGPVIYASNHASHFDGFFMMLCIYRVRGFPGARPVYWKGILDIPVVGPLLRAFGGFSISQDEGDKKQRTAETKAMLKALRQGESIHIAPEGKRNNELGHFHDGVALI
jgi:1-acyl-sn-glycerol-3-phosphate acyltransferase